MQHISNTPQKLQRECHQTKGLGYEQWLYVCTFVINFCIFFGRSVPMNKFCMLWTRTTAANFFVFSLKLNDGVIYFWASNETKSCTKQIYTCTAKFKNNINSLFTRHCPKLLSPEAFHSKVIIAQKQLSLCFFVCAVTFIVVSFVHS